MSRRPVACASLAEEDSRCGEDLLSLSFGTPARRAVSPVRHHLRNGMSELSGVEFGDTCSPRSPGGTNDTGAISSVALPPMGAVMGYALPSSVFEDPSVWLREYAQLRNKYRRPGDSIVAYHHHAAPLNSRTTMRHACLVCPLPPLETVQDALRRHSLSRASPSIYEVYEQQFVAEGVSSNDWNDDTVSVAAMEVDAGACHARREQPIVQLFPDATLWGVGGSNYDNEIFLYSSKSGQRLLRISDPKMKVAVTALQHAPFRAFMEAQQFQVLPVNQTQDVLRLKLSQLVFTDYVWCGFQDGTLRLLPADPQRVRGCEASPSFSKRPSVDLVYELPRHQGGAIVSIVRSPCHDVLCAADGCSPSAPLNRVSDAVRCMTAAAKIARSASGSHSDPVSRQHLDLVCVAATDASIVIWDIRRVYESVGMAEKQPHPQKLSQRGETHSRGASLTRRGLIWPPSTVSSLSSMSNDVITFDCASPLHGLQSTQVRSSCTLLNVKPLLKLSGGFAGLTALRWVSTLVKAGDSAGEPMRDARTVTRHTKMVPFVSEGLPAVELTQSQTRFEKREQQRMELEMTEEEMQGVEQELRNMLPPLAAEPLQSLRVNILVAADCVGALHIWNLDEELHQSNDGKGKDGLGWSSGFEGPFNSRLNSPSSHSEGRPEALFGGDTPESPSRRSGIGRSRGAGSKSVRGGRKADRVSRSPRTCGGLGLAEARASRTRLSQLPANTNSVTGSSADGDAVAGSKRHLRPSKARSSTEDQNILYHSQNVWQPPTRETDDRLMSAVPALGPPRKFGLTQQFGSPVDTAGLQGASSGLRCAVAPDALPRTKKRRNLNLAQKPPRDSAAGTPSSPTQSASPSRGSAQRVSPSPGRYSDNHLSTQPQASARPRASPQRGSSMSHSHGCSGASCATDLRMPPQLAKFKISFADGLSIADLAVNLPAHICLSMRRIPNPSHRTASLQQRPSEEEMDKRVLENQFEELTEERALFLALQQLEMYVGVDGDMTVVRCVPQWSLCDDDDRDLFKQRVNANRCAKDQNADWTAPPPSSLEDVTELPMPGTWCWGTFEIQLCKQLLDVHAQPITQLFLDPQLGHLWVSREDGYVSIFSTRDKSVVSRLVHPSADALLAPPLMVDSARLPESVGPRYRADDARLVNAFELDCHKECRGLPRNHLTQIVPLPVQSQRSLLLFCEAAADTSEYVPFSAANNDAYGCPITLSHSRRAFSMAEPSTGTSLIPCAPSTQELPSKAIPTIVHDAEISLMGSPRSNASALLCLDGRSDMKNAARFREGQQWKWLQQLQWWRGESAAVCQAQRRRYYGLCSAIGCSVAHVLQQLGDYVALSQLRSCFHQWRNHCQVFRHEHLMRRLRTARLNQGAGLALRMEAGLTCQLCGSFFVRWLRVLAVGKSRRREVALARFASAAVVTRNRVLANRRSSRGSLPTTAMMSYFHRVSATRGHWNAWRTWAAERRCLLNAEALPLPYASYLSSLPDRASSPRLTAPLLLQSQSHQHGTSASTELLAGFGGMRSGRVLYACSTSAEGPFCSGYQANEVEDAAAAVGPKSSQDLSADTAAATADSRMLMCPPPALEEVLLDLLRARSFVLHFSDVRSSTTSVLDESWTVVLDNAKSSAGSDDDDDQRFSVFCFALVPLLQGLLSTADDVLPNLFNASVAEEVASMLTGVVLAIDCVTADAEWTWWTLREVAQDGANGFAPPELPHHLSAFDASLTVLRSYAARAFSTNAETAEVLRELAKGKKVLDEFIDFAKERSVARRISDMES